MAMSEEMKPVKGVVIFTNGTYEERVFKQLKDLQDGVGGWIEPVRLYDGKGNSYATAYVDDEGLLKSKPMNHIGGALSFLLGNNPMLAGDMVIVGNADNDGWDTDINPTLLAFIKQILPEKTEQEDELV